MSSKQHSLIGSPLTPVIHPGVRYRNEPPLPGPLCAIRNSDNRAGYMGDYDNWVMGFRPPIPTALKLKPRFIPRLKDTGPFSKTDTDLGKFSHGDFDVAYEPVRAVLQVTLKLKFEFEEGITLQSQQETRRRMSEAIQFWDGCGVVFKSRDPVLNPVIALRFQMKEVASGEHYTVDVEVERDREFVAIDINIDKDTTVDTLKHELGHVFGNYDEYDGGFLENIMWWHDNDHHDDHEALMNHAGTHQGTEFRVRYFDHFERYINEEFGRIGARYTAVLGR